MSLEFAEILIPFACAVAEAKQPQTAYEIAHDMWGNIAVTQAYLTLSEVLGHTDLLVNDGRVREVVGDDGVARFEAT